jgi:hypothetical protein
MGWFNISMMEAQCAWVCVCRGAGVWSIIDQGGVKVSVSVRARASVRASQAKPSPRQGGVRLGVRFGITLGLEKGVWA